MLAKKLMASATAAPLTLTTNSTLGIVNNPSCVGAVAEGEVVISGGIAPYTILWSKVSGDGSILSGGTTTVVDVVFVVCPEETGSGVYRATVTDSASTVEAADVTLNFNNIAPIRE